MKFAVTNHNDMIKVIDAIRGKQTKQQPFTVTLTDGVQQQRTLSQNNSIHRYCEWLAVELNLRGETLRQSFLGREIEVEWTKDLVKQNIWKRTQAAMFPDKTSTTQLSRDEVTKVYDTLHRFFTEKMDINVPFPTREAA